MKLTCPRDIMAQNAYALIIGTSLLLGVVAGIVMHRSDFCVAGMFRNFFLFGHTFMLRCLVLLVAASMVLFEAAHQLGLLASYPFPLLGSPSLANVCGGFFFGIGMVLAGGCVVGTLYKMGSGSFPSFLAFIGLIAGSALYAEIHAWWLPFARATTFCPGKVTIPQMIGVAPPLVLAGMFACAIYPCRGWFRGGQWVRRSSAAGYLQPWRAAICLAFIGTLSYICIGMPLGVTTAYTKFGAYAERLFFPKHVAGLPYFQATSLDYLTPFGGMRLTGGAGPRLDAIAAIQFPLIAGIVCGGALSALMLHEFKVYVRVPLRQCVSAVAGGVIMGLASRMAPACSVWHLFGGLPVLAGQSVLFLVGLLPGAWLGSRILTKAVVV
jgi:uncharacterized membrane protein YedE/YeeE